MSWFFIRSTKFCITFITLSEDEEKKTNTNEIVPPSYAPSTFSSLKTLAQIPVETNISHLFEMKIDVQWIKVKASDTKYCCIICLNDTESGETIGNMSCFASHKYHKGCILKWWAEKAKRKEKISCPQCKQEVNYSYPVRQREVANKVDASPNPFNNLLQNIGW